jgi:hypothetical protein
MICEIYENLGPLPAVGGFVEINLLDQSNQIFLQTSLPILTDTSNHQNQDIFNRSPNTYHNIITILNCPGEDNEGWC